MSTDKLKLYEERKTRYLKALDCGKPDRVPVVITGAEFIIKFAGFTLQDIYYDPEVNYFKAMDAFLQRFDVDAHFGAPMLWWGGLHDAVGAVYLKFAGRELDVNTQFQYIEGEYMLPEDYDAFIENPTEWILTTFLPRIHKEFTEPGSYRANIALIKGAIARAMELEVLAQAAEKWAKEYGSFTAITGLSKAPFDTLGDTLRGLKGIMMDIRRIPEKVKAAMEVLVPHNIYYGLATAGGDTEFPVFIPLHRGAFPFLNPKQWDEFYWPTLKRVIEGLWERGKRTLFYAEGDWTPYLEKIAELPDKSIVFHVDRTDMDKAKKILGGRFCLKGNVPNSLLSIGKPEEVKDYVKRLIDTYAADGGFIVDSAAVLQADSNPRNVEAMIEAVYLYGKY
ncbi:uroporphyrinogen decarboxylase family protein [Carboxydothermus pertinax]|uniref:Uroporphyrinogen decarboxylase n=1 Tax=Carboxydothermus pertinax TaxID=870242 RepID=A0A1L8CVJ6_9THEO|nr:uroporphyrinogen decarboxylase family protein [Carboxydothermus pertinax]GAV22917.1 uroporphyrinogen decarboxylase [Carboxydothermus pertinax]